MRELMAEHEKESKKVSELGTFKAAKVYEQALNILIGGTYLPEYCKDARLSVIKEIKDYDELRKTFGEDFTPTFFVNE